MIVDNPRHVSAWSFIQPGTVIVAIDGFPIEPTVVAESLPDHLRLVDTPDNVTERRLYRGSHETVTVREDVPYVLTDRERLALRRNRRYVPLLTSLLPGPRLADNRGEGVTLAGLSAEHQNAYGWTERGPRIDGRRSWQITQHGREALAAYQRSRV